MKILLIVPQRDQADTQPHPGARLTVPSINRWFERKFAKPWMPPMSVLEVTAMVPSGWEVTIHDELVSGRLTEETLPEADVYGLTGLTTARLRQEKLARMIRGLCGDCVIAGGRDVMGRALDGETAEMAATFGTIIPTHLTRRVFAQALGDIVAGRSQGVYAAEEDEWDEVIPRHDLVRAGDYFLPATIRSSFGCGNRCKWCSVDRRRRSKSATALEQELACLPQSPLFIDCSDTFGVNDYHTRDVVLPLYRSTGRRWLTETSARNLLRVSGGKMLAEWMAEAGCVGIYIGFENPFHLLGVKSMALAEYERVIKLVRDLGMFVIGSFILDSGEQTTEASVKRTVEWAIEQQLDGVQYSLEATLPGTEARHEAIASDSIIDYNPEHYDGAWPTRAHPILGPRERLRLLPWAYDQTYDFPTIGDRLSFGRGLGARMWLWLLLGNLGVRFSHRAWKRFANYDYWQKTRWQRPGGP